MIKIKQLTFLFFLLLGSSLLNAATIYVDVNATGSNNGASWTNAYTALQDAINASSAGDEIWIAAGTYKPTRLPSNGATSSTSRNLAFYNDKNIGIYGGFAGTETSKNQRNISSNEVILSGDIGTTGTTSDNCYHVVILESLSSSGSLNNVSIKHGNANGSSSITFSGSTINDNFGGGLHIRIGNPSINGCLITDNLAASGGGIYLHGTGTNNFNNGQNYTSANFVDCAIVDNTATSNGGGAYCNWNGNGNFYNCIFYNNSANDGGAVRNTSHTHPDFYNCAFIKNSATSAGGAFQSWSSCYINVYNSIFYGNTSGGTGRNDIHAMNSHEASLHWATASEINNSHFDVERSYDGRTFEVVGEVAGNGNSQHLIEYSYSDETIAPLENTVFYRLKQVDFDGAYEYSDIRVVRFDEVGRGIDFSSYPNPITNELNVMVNIPNGEAYQISVTNLQGASVYHENHNFNNGIHKLNTSAWNSGMYILSVASDQGTKFVKVVKK